MVKLMTSSELFSQEMKIHELHSLFSGDRGYERLIWFTNSPQRGSSSGRAHQIASPTDDI